MIVVESIDLSNKIYNVSNPIKAQIKAFEYLGENAILYLSNRKNKKYMIHDPNKNIMVHFGDINYFDYLKHNDLYRRNRYIKRASKIKGNWKDNKYSPNNLSLNILW